MKRIVNNPLALFIVLFTVNLCLGQNQSLTTKEIIQAIAKNNYVAPIPDGFIHSETAQYKLYETLQKVATTDELVSYTDDERPIVRVYALKCLDQRKYSGLYQLALAHLHDTGQVNESGHLSSKQSVGNYFMEVTSLTVAERLKLDSTILYTDNQLFYLNNILRELTPLEVHYDRVRHLATTNDCAVLALARYKKESDVDLIARQILADSYTTIRAIELFPHESFKRTLLLLRDQGYNYYGTELAVAAFQDDFAVDYFNNKLQSERNNYQKHENSKYIFEAISTYRNPIFDQLFFTIWRDDQIINTEIFNYLASVDKKECLVLSEQSLNDPKKVTVNGDVISLMLEMLIRENKQIAQNILIANIGQANVHTCSFFIEKAVHFQNKEVTDALFLRLRTTDNPHIYIPIVNAILDYKNDELNQKLRATIAENQGINDWGLQKVKTTLKNAGIDI